MYADIYLIFKYLDYVDSKFHVLHDNVGGHLTDEVIKVVNLDAIRRKELLDIFCSFRLIFVAYVLIFIKKLACFGSLSATFLFDFLDKFFHR